MWAGTRLLSGFPLSTDNTRLRYFQSPSLFIAADRTLEHLNVSTFTDGSEIGLPFPEVSAVKFDLFRTTAPLPRHLLVLKVFL
jgi:hypothetical protein